MNKNDNKKYGVKPEILEKLVLTKKDKIYAGTPDKPSTLIQGLVATPPEKWDFDQLERAKHHKLNEKTLDELRYWMDNEPEPQGNYRPEKSKE